MASINDPARFAEIFDRHADAIRRFAMTQVGNGAADDGAAERFHIAFDWIRVILEEEWAHLRYIRRDLALLS